MVRSMAESSPVNPADPGLEVRTSFVRGRNVLLARAKFSELFVDYYVHRGEHQVQVEATHDLLFKRLLAGFVLHCGSRPWNEMTAWTVNFQQPLLNVFLTGDNETGAVTGRVFTENVKEAAEGVFYSDVVRPRQPKRRSVVNFAGSDPLVAIETFYRQSEQMPARVFELADEEYVLAVEHPDADHAWFEALTADAIPGLETTETVAPLERRIYRWHCGCNQERMMEVLAPVMRSDPEGLFGGTETVQIHCPRCAARHTITRESLEAFIARQS